MNKVIVELDEGWRFWIESFDSERNRHIRFSHLNEITLTDEEMAEYEKFRKLSHEWHTRLEQLYRHQQGMDPFEDSPFHPGKQPK